MLAIAHGPTVAALSPKAILAVLIAIGFVLVIIGIVKEQAAPGRINPHLLRAAKGDRKLAARLLENARFRYPGKSDRWYVEKIIYDLERDGAGSGRGRKVDFDSRDTREKLWTATAFLAFFSMLTRVAGDLMGGRDRM